MGCDRLSSWTLAPCCEVPDTTDPAHDTFVKSLAAAVQFVDDLTCNQYGLCSMTAYPIGLSSCAPFPLWYVEQFYASLDTPGRFGWDGTVRLDLLPLFGRVDSITSVTTTDSAGNPALVAAGDYALASNRFLIPKIPGALYPWPVQVPNAGVAGASSWHIVAQVGRAIPQNVLLAASDVACQLFKSCTGQVCDLPPGASSVTRDGVTVSFRSDFEQIPSVTALKDTMTPCSQIALRRGRKIFDPVRRFAGTVYT